MEHGKTDYMDLIDSLNRKAEKRDAEQRLASIEAQELLPRRRTHKDREHEVQSACVRWFALQYPQYKGLLFAVPNGGQRNAIVAAKLKAEGVVAGVADLMLAIPKTEDESSGTVTISGKVVAHGLFIEMKTEEKSSRQRASQKEWQEKVERQGYAYRICRSLEEFMRTINGYLGNGKESESKR